METNSKPKNKIARSYAVAMIISPARITSKEPAYSAAGRTEGEWAAVIAKSKPNSKIPQRQTWPNRSTANGPLIRAQGVEPNSDTCSWQSCQIITAAARTIAAAARRFGITRRGQKAPAMKISVAAASRMISGTSKFNVSGLIGACSLRGGQRRILWEQARETPMPTGVRRRGSPPA